MLHYFNSFPGSVIFDHFPFIGRNSIQLLSHIMSWGWCQAPRNVTVQGNFPTLGLLVKGTWFRTLMNKVDWKFHFSFRETWFSFFLRLFLCDWFLCLTGIDPLAVTAVAAVQHAKGLSCRIPFVIQVYNFIRECHQNMWIFTQRKYPTADGCYSYFMSEVERFFFRCLCCFSKLWINVVFTLGIVCP